MNDENKYIIEINLPKKLEDNLSSMLSDKENIEYYSLDKKNKKIEVIYNEGGNRVRQTLDVLPDGVVNTNSKFFTQNDKKSYRDTIKELARNHTQDEIASMLGMSQGYVSRLLSKV